MITSDINKKFADYFIDPNNYEVIFNAIVNLYTPDNVVSTTTILGSNYMKIESTYNKWLFYTNNTEWTPDYGSVYYFN